MIRPNQILKIVYLRNPTQKKCKDFLISGVTDTPTPRIEKSQIVNYHSELRHSNKNKITSKL